LSQDVLTADLKIGTTQTVLKRFGKIRIECEDMGKGCRNFQNNLFNKINADAMYSRSGDDLFQNFLLDQLSGLDGMGLFSV
jgi:hypothetical protein